MSQSWKAGCPGRGPQPAGGRAGDRGGWVGTGGEGDSLARFLKTPKPTKVPPPTDPLKAPVKFGVGGWVLETPHSHGISWRAGTGLGAEKVLSDF